jgi:hypothetical protein
VRAWKPLILALLTAAGVARGFASLDPGEPDPSAWPFAAGELTVHNPSETPVASVALRWKRGGPTMVRPARLAPGEQKTLPVMLPAVWAEQTYTVRLRDPRAEMVAAGETTIGWPLERVRSEAFIDPETWQRWDPPAPAWSGATRRGALVAAGLVALAAAGTLLVRRPGLRLGLLLAVLAGGCAAMALLRPEPVDRWTPPVTGPAEDGAPALLAVAARRTTGCELSEGLLAPVYFSRRELAGDEMVMDVATGRARVKMHAGQVRLFRRVGGPAQPPSR